MIVDSDGPDRARFATSPFDVCIIGAGPAGITLARRLAAAGQSVALMEAGGLEPTIESNAVYEGEIAGLDYFPLETCRQRFYGGTSNHWAGWSRALDAVDFEAKPWNLLSGWPISIADLDPYRAETDAILDLPPVAPDGTPVQAEDRFRSFQMRFSTPTRFGPKYRDEIAAAPGILLGLNANLVDLRLTPDLEAVRSAQFRGYGPDDPGFGVQARRFVMAAGGIETPRLLLNFTAQMPAGIGNQNDLVGRYFCEHPHFVLADALLRAPIEDVSFFAPSRAFLEAEQTLNFGLRLEPGQRGGAGAVPICADGEGDFEARLGEAFTRDPEICPPPGPTGRIRMAYEQALDPESRVRLGEETDRFGLRRPVLDWRLGTLDAHTMRSAVLGFGAHMAEQDFGRLRVRDWVLADPPPIPDILSDEVGGKHHMGTTRMADDPRAGVVDRNCQVHGTQNLYIAGSSVFATPGHANPTYTVVQLALRLGDHLAEDRQAPSP